MAGPGEDDGDDGGDDDDGDDGGGDGDGGAPDGGMPGESLVVCGDYPRRLRAREGGREGLLAIPTPRSGLKRCCGGEVQARPR